MTPPAKARRGAIPRPCPRRAGPAVSDIPSIKNKFKNHIMKNSRIALALLALAALAATGFATANSGATKAADDCKADSKCCCACGDCCSK